MSQNTTKLFRFVILKWRHVSATAVNSALKLNEISFSFRVIYFMTYTSVSQPLWDRGPVNSFFIRRGPGPNKFTRK